MQSDTARKLLYLSLLVLCLQWPASAQINISSPYSRYGVGDLSGNNNSWNFTMGQAGIALQSPLHINITNPASYGSFDSLSFVFNGGFSAENVSLTSRLQSTTRTYASLGYISFGIPLFKFWRTSLSMVPYSDVGYNVVTYEKSSSAGDILMLYSGSGGINRFIWGNAFNIGKNLSIGANISYLFGNMTRESTAMFPDSIHSMNFKVDNYITTGDFYFNFGVQYKQKIKNDLSLVFGAVYAPTTRINATASGNAHTFLIGANGIEYPKDTIATFDAYEGKLVLPWTAGGGIAIQKTDMFVATVDYTYQNWSSFTAFGLSDSLANSNKICAGAEITPNAFNFSSYFSRVRYRLGFYYDRTYLLLRGRQLNEYGITLGFGFPLKGMRTMINIGGQFGSRGTVQGDLIKETYFKFVVGFSIYERWFHKRKYY